MFQVKKQCLHLNFFPRSNEKKQDALMESVLFGTFMVPQCFSSWINSTQVKKTALSISSGASLSFNIDAQRRSAQKHWLNPRRPRAQ